ncbi:MAG: zinc ribbon domain-containing protein [Actinomycetes bacterium]
MANYCEQCGSELGFDAQYCGECGEPVDSFSLGSTGTPTPAPPPAASSAPSKSMPADVNPVPAGEDLPPGEQIKLLWASAAGPTDCPGCKTTQGTPGSICPACGSRYPSPKAALVGIVLFALGALLLLLALIVNGGLLQETSSGASKVSGLEGTGWFALIAGLVGLFYSVGRNGPKTQTSCCGCSCVVVILMLPAAGIGLWVTSGPALAAAVIPAAIPIMWVLDGATVLAWLCVETGSLAIRSARQTQ